MWITITNANMELMDKIKWMPLLCGCMIVVVTTSCGLFPSVKLRDSDKQIRNLHLNTDTLQKQLVTRRGKLQETTWTRIRYLPPDTTGRQYRESVTILQTVSRDSLVQQESEQGNRLSVVQTTRHECEEESPPAIGWNKWIWGILGLLIVALWVKYKL